MTSYRSIRRKKSQQPMDKHYLADFALARATYDDGFETVQVPQRELVTFWVDIATLADWLDEDLTGQRKLPGIGRPHTRLVETKHTEGTWRKSVATDPQTLGLAKSQFDQRVLSGVSLSAD